MNHPLSEAFVRTNTSPFKGGYYSHGKQFIETLPIPVPSDEARTAIEERVATLIRRLDDLSTMRMPRDRTQEEREITDLKQQIQQHVSQVFGLNDDDHGIINAVPIPD